MLRPEQAAEALAMSRSFFAALNDCAADAARRIAEEAQGVRQGTHHTSGLQPWTSFFALPTVIGVERDAATIWTAAGISVSADVLTWVSEPGSSAGLA